jgi:NAD+ kinase
MEAVMAGQYRTEDRMTLQATLGPTTLNGVNDVVVEKVDTTRLVHIDVTVDGESFITYRADGLIVATPTGSTAYSFSAGGPLIDPTMEALVITPVASHSLFNRAIVLPATSVIGLEVSRDREARGNVDKTPLGVIGEGGRVEVRRGDHPVRFVAFGTRRFPSVVRQKFRLT